MRYPLTTIALGPVLIAQGIATRLRTPLLPEPPGARTGSAGTGRDLRLLVAGDSAAAGVGAPHQDQALAGQLVSILARHYRVAWELHATTGHKTADTLERLHAMSPRRFDVAVTSLGVNDVTGMVGKKHWQGGQARLRHMLRRKFGVSHLVISGLPPVHGFPALPQPLRWHIGGRASEFDADLRAAVTNEPDCSFIDLRFTEDTTLMADDGFHPGPPVYAEWAKRVAAAIIDRGCDNAKLRSG